MMATLNWVDFLLIAIICLFTIGGLVRGLMREILAIITLVVAVVVAVLYTTAFSDYLMSLPSVKSLIDSSSQAVGTSTEQTANYLLLAMSFASLFITISIIGGLLSWFLNAVFASSSLGIANRFFGGIIGFVKGAGVCLIAIFIIQLTPFSAEAWWQQSESVKRSAPYVGQLGAYVSPKLSDMESQMDKMTSGMGEAVQNVKAKASETMQNVTDSVSDAASSDASNGDTQE